MAGPTLLLATSNPGKRGEFARLLPPAIELVTLADLSLVLPDEVGSTFAEIASAKARAASTASRLLALADDSGLEVDALGGAPGVYSARWEGLPDGAEKNALLLSRLAQVPWDERGARYVCHMVLIDRRGAEHQAEGECRGRIALEARGEGGFGYDPVMYVPELGRTMAELSPAEKDRISHRGAAAAQLRTILVRLLGRDDG